MRQTHKTLDPVSVTLHRGDGLAFTATVTIGETQLDEVTTDNTVVTSRQRSFFVDAINYDFGNGPVEPDSTNGAWQFSDRARTYYRINTVEVE